MSSSISASEAAPDAAIGSGLASLALLGRWLIARLWLALALCAAVAVALRLLVPEGSLPPYGGDHAIVDEQIARSRTIGATDVLILGDSSGLTGIDPEVVSRRLGGRSVEMLSVIGPVRPPGYARLLRNYLDRGLPLEAAIFVLHPFALMHRFDEAKATELAAVLSGRWPSDGAIGDLRRAINRYVFGGLLETPLPGSSGAFYGNDRELRAYLERTHGSFIHPGTPMHAHDVPVPAKIDYRLGEDGRTSVEHMRAVLGPALATAPIYLAFAPVPASIAGETEAGSRERLLRQVVQLLGLPPERALLLPPALPDDLMVDPTHASARGRASYSAHVAPLLAKKLGVARSSR